MDKKEKSPKLKTLTSENCLSNYLDFIWQETIIQKPLCEGQCERLNSK